MLQLKLMWKLFLYQNTNENINTEYFFIYSYPKLKNSDFTKVKLIVVKKKGPIESSISLFINMLILLSTIIIMSPNLGCYMAKISFINSKI